MKIVSPLYLKAGQDTRVAENLSSGMASAPLSDKVAKSFAPQSSWPRAAIEQQPWAVKAHECSGLRTIVAQGRDSCGEKRFGYFIRTRHRSHARSEVFSDPSFLAIFEVKWGSGPTDPRTHGPTDPSATIWWTASASTTELIAQWLKRRQSNKRWRWG